MNFGNLITKEEMYSKIDYIVEKIKEINNKNIQIITHGDIDGFVSAYSLEKYLSSLGEFNIKSKSISYDDLIHFDEYCNKLDFQNKIIIILDIFDQKFITKFEWQDYFIIDHHDGQKKYFVNENMINIANYFTIDIVPSMGSYMFGYVKSKEKISFPSWFSLVARFSDHTFESNEFFIPLTKEEKEANFFMGLPRSEVVDFIEFINTFFNNPLEIDEIYHVFKQCVDSGNIFYYLFSNSKELIYLRDLKKEIDKTRDKLLKKCLTKHKKYEKERLVIFNLNEKENGARRLIQNQLEYAFIGYNILILIKKDDIFVISYRTNTTKFDVVKNLKPIYDVYCKFGGHPFAAGGFVKAELKKRFIKDTLAYLRKYYLEENKK